MAASTTSTLDDLFVNIVAQARFTAEEQSIMVVHGHRIGVEAAAPLGHHQGIPDDVKSGRVGVLQPQREGPEGRHVFEPEVLHHPVAGPRLESVPVSQQLWCRRRPDESLDCQKESRRHQGDRHSG